MSDYILTFIATFLDEAPWWFFVLSIIIPLFFLLALRESYGWFTKGSGVNKKLAKLDETLNLILEELKNQKPEKTENKIIENKIIKDTKFSLEEEKEEFKLK